MAPRQYQIPLPPKRYSVAAAVRTAKSWGITMETPFKTATLSACVPTQTMEEKTRGTRQGSICTAVWRDKISRRSSRTVAVKFSRARNRIATAQGFLRLSSMPPMEK